MCSAVFFIKLLASVFPISLPPLLILLLLFLTTPSPLPCSHLSNTDVELTKWTDANREPRVASRSASTVLCTLAALSLV